MSRLDVDADPVAARIARILEAKRRDNADVVSALNVAQEAWERLNKEVDTSIGQEFDLLVTERDAVLAAKDRLENPVVDPTDDGFVFAGRVFDRTTKAGLPKILVRVFRDRIAEPLAETVTDSGGMYRALVPNALLDQTGAETVVRIEAFAEAGARPVGTDRRAVVMRPGGSERVDLPVGRVRGVADRVTAGEAARDSVDETVASVERRLESMKAAHTATARFADLTRDGLKELSDAIAGDPPPISDSVTIVGVDPVTPPAPPEPRTSTSLEEIEGIGPRRAEKLRDAGIPDVEALVRAKHETLVEILGEERAKIALAAAEKLLAQR